MKKFGGFAIENQKLFSESDKPLETLIASMIKLRETEMKLTSHLLTSIK
jgi:hypothetical protein